MSAAAPRSAPAPSLDPPDPQFRLAVGLYVGLLVVPFALLAGSMVGITGPAPLYGLFLGAGILVVGIAMWAVGLVDGAAERLGNSRLRWLLPVAPVALVAGSFAAIETFSVAAIAGIFLGALATVAGFVLPAMARSRYVRAVRDAVLVDAEWRAGWPEKAKHRLQIVAGSLAIVGIAGFAIDALRWDLGGFWYLGQVLLTSGIVITTVAQPKDYAATPNGLVVERGGFRRLYPWDRFDGFARTDDALVCRRQWRIDFRFARDDLDDPAAVERAIGRYLE